MILNSRVEVPVMLKKVYNYRLEGSKGSWDIKTTEQLEELLKDSEREFYFYLTYAYISNLDLNSILTNDSLALRLAVSIYTEQARLQGYDCICEYLNQFMVTDESVVQAKKVINEIRMAEERERIENGR